MTRNYLDSRYESKVKVKIIKLWLHLYVKQISLTCFDVGGSYFAH